MPASIPPDPTPRLAAACVACLAAVASPQEERPSPAPDASPDTSPDAPDDDGPWRLGGSLPAWLSITFEQRTRYESQDGRFRRGFSGSDQGLYLRNRVELTLRPGIPQATLELMDSRQELADTGSPLNTTHVNAAELIQAFGALNLEDVLADGDTLFVQAGRLTMDLGSRRLVARNRYRNTVNTFTGLNAVWTSASGARVQAFWTLPVERLPADRDSLLDNEVAWDEETLDVHFWGLAGAIPDLVGRTRVEGYILGLHERDGSRATRNRELYTVGARIGPPPKAGSLDVEIESVIQFGTSRAGTAASDTTDLDHLAFFQHAEVGYTFTGDARLRIAALVDYASGDDDPADGDNNRFDPLFGARRFDFGPTGIFGPFARSNIVSPGYTVSLRPATGWSVMLAHRFYWLASASDQLVTAGLRDPTGDAGSSLGTMPEAAVRWDAIPGNLRLEAGLAYLFKGGYFERVPDSPGDGDVAYVYLQTTLTF